MINFDFGLKFFQIDLVVKVGTHEELSNRLVPTTSPLKSLHERTCRRTLSHEHFTRSVLRNKPQGIVPKIHTGLNSWNYNHGQKQSRLPEKKRQEECNYDRTEKSCTASTYCTLSHTN